MKTRIVCGLLSGCLLLSAPPSHAAWHFSRIDSFSDPYYRFEQGEFLYAKNLDVVHYGISTDEKTLVTDNGGLIVEAPVWVEDGRVWYVSHPPGGSTGRNLLRYDVASGERELLYTAQEEIWPYDAARCSTQLLVEIGRDWWLWDGTGMEQLTFSGSSLPKWDPFLSGNHLVWVGAGRVYHTYLPTRETRAVSEGVIENRSLQASSTHAAWVEPARAGEPGYRIQLVPLGSLDVVAADTSLHAALDPIRFHPPHMIYVKSGPDGWSVVRVLPYTPVPETLYTSTLPLDQPRLHGGDLFFLASSCGDNLCTDLVRHNLASGITDRLTSYGQGIFVNDYEVVDDRVAFVRCNLYEPDRPHELFAGQVEPGSLCGTLPAGTPAQRPLNLALLIAPLAGSRHLRRRMRRARPRHAASRRPCERPPGGG